MAEGWHRWVGTFTGVALIAVAVLPLAALAVWALARRRSVNGTAPAWRMSLAEVGIVYGTVPWVWMIMLPGDRGGLLGPGRGRAVRPAAGPGVLRGRRTAQHRRRWGGRAGVAPLVARYGQSVL